VGDYFEPTREGADPLDGSLQGMADFKQSAPIGTVFSYNNSGFQLASKVLESITGERYENY
jgi:CubicO group peptidase (beta-lactamase class C family)